MEKLEEYEAITENVSFTLEIFKDSERGRFLGQISGHTPPLFSEVAPGQTYPEMKMIDSEEIKSESKEGLIELSKKRMIEIGGNITHFIKRKSE